MKQVTLFISPAENQPGRHLVVVNGQGFFESVGKPSAPAFAGRMSGSTTNSLASVALASNVCFRTGVSACRKRFRTVS